MKYDFIIIGGGMSGLVCAYILSKEGKKVIGTYYFNTERSSASQIVDRASMVPGKWRSCEISVEKGKHRYSIEVADKEKTVLTRFILY